MKKKKIKDAVKRRFKVTKTGKVMFAHQYKGHLMTKKSGSRKRRQRILGVLAPGFARKVRALLGVSTKVKHRREEIKL
jgi:ribosomal protein L35